MEEKHNARAHKIRESWVRVMEARLVREKLKECALVEGVNKNQVCKQLVEQYQAMLVTHRVENK